MVDVVKGTKLGATAFNFSEVRASPAGKAVGYSRGGRLNLTPNLIRMSIWNMNGAKCRGVYPPEISCCLEEWRGDAVAE